MAQISGFLKEGPPYSFGSLKGAKTMRNQAKRSKRLQILVTETEQAAMKEKATASGMSLSDYIRRCTLADNRGEVKIQRVLGHRLCELREILSKREYDKLKAWEDEIWLLLR